MARVYVLILVLGLISGIALQSIDEDINPFSYLNRKRRRKREKNMLEVLDILKKKASINGADDISQYLKVSNKQARRYLDKLEIRGLIDRHDDRGNIYYTLNRN
ncbi:MAG: hypothetical protein WD061_01545 [Candidatus Saccharimonadales bacterium]